MNPITLIDGYKLDHRRQYPEGTTKVLANWTPRESRIPGIDRVIFFGLQYFLQRYLIEEMAPWFEDEHEAMAARDYRRRVAGYLGPAAADAVGVEHIQALHALGYLPVEFRAVPEGTRVPLQVPMLTIENTHPDFFWLPNYLETVLSNVLWLPCTSATTADRMRRLLDAAALETGTDPGFVPWQGHDFSFRGMSGVEAAQLSGAAHLLSFTGTDTIPAIDLIEQFYGHGLPADHLIGGSVAATEHSVMCAGGELGEMETFRRLLALYPAGIVSVVSDTWDLWRVLLDILPALQEPIRARAGKLVIRPDSGDPERIICGDPSAIPGSPAARGVLDLLWQTFGGTTTATGHRQLAGCVGVIYGDAITYDRAQAITARMAQQGWASGNVVFGVGSYTYQYVTRDTFGFAMKATWCERNGIGYELHKAPITGAYKRSACGRLAVVPGLFGLDLVQHATAEDEARSLLQPVWRDGAFVRRESFDVIRGRVAAQRAESLSSATVTA